MLSNSTQLWIAFGSLVVAIAMAVWVVVWKLSDVTKAVTDSVDTKLKEASKFEGEKRHALRGELTSQIAVIGTELGKDIEAVRRGVTEFEKTTNDRINKMEIAFRDRIELYVLKEDFREDFATITKLVDTLGTRIEMRLKSFEEKLDKLQEFNMKRLQQETV